MSKKNLFVLVALLVPGLVFGDAYEAPFEVMVPVSFQEPEPASDALSCHEARSTAWFERELARTDGGPAPDVEYASCKPELLAHSTADAD